MERDTAEKERREGERKLLIKGEKKKREGRNVKWEGEGRREKKGGAGEPEKREKKGKEEPTTTASPTFHFLNAAFRFLSSCL